MWGTSSVLDIAFRQRLATYYLVHPDSLAGFIYEDTSPPAPEKV